MPPKRRAVLPSMSAGIAGTAATGVASADCTSGREFNINEKYHSQQGIQDVINNHQEFLTAASRNGVIDTQDIQISSNLSIDKYAQSDSGARACAMFHPKQKETTFITVRRQTKRGEAIISFAPELRGRKPVIYVKSEKNRGKVYRASNGNRRVEKQTVRRSQERISEVDVAADDVTTDGVAGVFCTWETDDNSCMGDACWKWEGACVGGWCELYDCTGKRCCGGCCCCPDLDYCCELCGDGCSPCDNISNSCPGSTGCSGC